MYFRIALNCFARGCSAFDVLKTLARSDSVGLTLRAENNGAARIGLKKKPSTSIPIRCC